MDKSEISWPLTPETLAALPQAQATNSGRNPWRAVHGKYYRHWDNYLVKARKNGNVNGYNRMCLECGASTHEQSDKCPKHGGPSQSRKHCTAMKNGAPCGIVAHYKTDGGPRCTACYVIDNPERGCKRCHTLPALLTNNEGLCYHCRDRGKRDANKNSKEAQLEDLLKRGDVEIAPNNTGTGWKTGTKYAMQNKLDDQNYGLFIKSGNRPVRACMDLNCMQKAQKTPGKKIATHCAQHGGGIRCPGPPGEDKCPYDNYVTPKCDKQVWYDGLCCGCFCKGFPEDERAINAKKHMLAKEQAVREALVEHFKAKYPQLKWVMDRAVEGTLRRPDYRPLIHLLGIKSHDLIIENDENSHWMVLCADERDKEAAVHYWLSRKKRPLIWIRFNPDAYDDPVTGVRVTSCFGKGPLGTTIVKPSKRTEWRQRLAKLFQVVEEYMEDRSEAWAAMKDGPPPGDTFVPIELFYDNVLEKRPQATAAHEAIKRAAKSRKRERERASTPSEASCSVDV